MGKTEHGRYLARAEMVGRAQEWLQFMRMGLVSVACCSLEGSRSCYVIATGNS